MRCLPERIIGRRRSAGYDATLLGAAAAAKPQQPSPPADNVILRRRRSPTQHADGHAGVAGVAESVRRSWRDEFDAACAAAVHGAADGRADEKVEYQESSVLRELEGLYPVAFELDVRSDPAHAHMLQLYCGMDLLGTVLTVPAPSEHSAFVRARMDACVRGARAAMRGLVCLCELALYACACVGRRDGRRRVFCTLLGRACVRRHAAGAVSRKSEPVPIAHSSPSESPSAPAEPCGVPMQLEFQFGRRGAARRGAARRGMHTCANARHDGMRTVPPTD
jgi:hypothetical protein